jgi:ribosomal protein S18 acetylase RimI-like enzyme
MIENLRISKMTTKEINLIHDFHLKNANEINENLVPWLMETIDDSFGYLYSAYLEDELVGYCGMYHNTPSSNPEIQIPDYCKIADIIVSKEHQRKGIGRALMTEMLNKVNELGIDRTKLEVSVNNNQAIKLYESFGFQIEDTIENFYDLTDNDDGHIMWRYS